MDAVDRLRASRRRAELYAAVDDVEHHWDRPPDKVEVRPASSKATRTMLRRKAEASPLLLLNEDGKAVEVELCPTRGKPRGPRGGPPKPAVEGANSLWCGGGLMAGEASRRGRW